MDIFLMIALTHFIALVSPGPDFFLLLTTLIGKGRRAAIWVCLGIVFGNALILLFIYSCMSLLGQFDAHLLQYVQYLGALYLVYLAFCCVKAARQPFLLNAVVDAAPPIKLNRIKYWALGLQSSLFNPKNILFYSSLIVMVYAQFSIAQHIFICVWMLAVVMIWNLLLLRLLDQAAWMNWLKRQARAIYLLSACCFLMFAVLCFWFNIELSGSV